MTERERWTGAQLAVIVPTKDRPQKLSNLLESLARQSEPVGRVIVVDGGASVEHVVNAFRPRVEVEYHRCEPPGQIRQRNHGLAQLDDRTRLVAILDDDIVLEPEAVEHMVAFWNETRPDTAGVAFNVVNEPPHRFSRIRWLLGLTAPQPGRVLRSGITTPVTQMQDDVRTQWLPGGATVWRKEVLQGRAHREVAARWAIAEDLIFSYPVGKQRPLYVCARARVRHEHEADYGLGHLHHRYHGRVQTLWMYRFVAENPDLSSPLYLWSVLLRMAGKFGVGIARRERASVEFARGQASAVRDIVHARLRGVDPIELLQERANPAR